MNINPGANLLLKAVVGSRGFGLATETSDTDYLGLFVAPTKLFHGLGTVQESFSFKNPDTAYHEAGKYCRLALKCNPTVLDLLWVENYNVRTQLGAELVNLRSNVLSASYVKSSYIGYATQQLAGLKQDSKPKQARHMLRLLHQGYELYTTGTYSVRLADPQKFIDFGNNAVKDLSLAQDMLEKYREKFEAKVCVLPEKANTAPIEDWLLKVRHEFYKY